VGQPWLAIALERRPKPRFARRFQAGVAISGLSASARWEIHPATWHGIEPLSTAQSWAPSGQSMPRRVMPVSSLRLQGPCRAATANWQGSGRAGLGVGCCIVGISCQWQAAPQFLAVALAGAITRKGASIPAWRSFTPSWRWPHEGGLLGPRRGAAWAPAGHPWAVSWPDTAIISQPWASRALDGEHAGPMAAPFYLPPRPVAGWEQPQVGEAEPASARHRSGRYPIDR